MLICVVSAQAGMRHSWRQAPRGCGLRAGDAVPLYLSASFPWCATVVGRGAVARALVAAEGEQYAALVAGDDLSVVGYAVAVPVEEDDVAGFGLPAPPGRAMLAAVLDGVGAVGEAGPAAGLHRWQGNLRALVDVGDVVTAPRLRGTAQIGAERVRAVVALAVAGAVAAEGGTDDLVSGSHCLRVPLASSGVYLCVRAAQRLSVRPGRDSA